MILKYTVESEDRSFSRSEEINLLDYRGLHDVAKTFDQLMEYHELKWEEQKRRHTGPKPE